MIEEDRRSGGRDASTGKARRHIAGLTGVLVCVLLMSIAIPVLAAPARQAATPQAPSAGNVTVSTPVPMSGPLSPPDAVAGRATFSQYCAPCHGDTGNGDGPGASGLQFKPFAFADPKLVGAAPLSELFNVAKNGRMARMMPPWGSQLNDQQIWDVVGYAWTLHTSPSEVNQGKTVYQANCASCHGVDGKGKAPMLDLTSFAATSVISQTAWAQIVANGVTNAGDTMPGYTGKLDAAGQAAALEYVRSLSFKQEFRGPLAAGSGVISGTVTNGTANQPLANQSMTLHIFDGNTLLESREAKTDAKAFYRFGSLPDDTTLSYAVSTQGPGNLPYGSDVQSFAAGHTGLDMPVTVYETTTDGSGISAGPVHFIVEFDQGQMLIAELLVFNLSGNKTYLGDSSSVLRVTVPKGAQNLTIQDGNLGERYKATADGFVDTLPLPPGIGSRQILYRYTLPYTGDTLDLVRSLPYPATNVNALISDLGEKVSSPQLAAQPVRQTQSGNYLSLLGPSVAANQQVSLHFTNLPGPGALQSSSAAQPGGASATGTGGLTQTLTLVVIALAGFAAVALISWPLLRRRAAAGAPFAAGPGAAAPEAAGTPVYRRNALVDELARLDLAHEAGEISDADYRDRRLHLKAQLSDAIRQEQRSGGINDGRAHGG